jgi:hypothetical protein
MKRGLFHAVRDHNFERDICFLCGDRAGRTVEHVIPKWLQRSFELWDQRIRLLNGTLIPYRALVVPCCGVCNGQHLASLEREVSERVDAGATAVRGMNRVRLAQWLLKVFYGFVYREVFLPSDRSRAESGTILSATDMENFQLLHYILQSIRIPMRFTGYSDDVPASIFVFELKEARERGFDYKDDVVHQCMALRIGRVGVLVAFDMGAQAVEGAEFFSRFFDHALHPLQFDELAANLFAKARSLSVVPKVMFSESPNGIRFDALPMCVSPFREIFEDLEMDTVADLLSRFSGLPRDVVSPRRGRRITFLTHADGTIRDIPIEL